MPRLRAWAVAHAHRAKPRAELLPIEASVAELGQRLARRVVSERAFTAHAAHALRTPVAGIDVQLALAIKEVPDATRPRLLRAREAAGRLGRVMQALLMMFRSGIEPKNLFKIFLGIALECNRDEWMPWVRRMGWCPCKQPGRQSSSSSARFHSNPCGQVACRAVCVVAPLANSTGYWPRAAPSSPSRQDTCATPKRS